MPRCFFLLCGNQKLLHPPVKIRICCPKTTKFGQKLAFLVIFGQALPAHLVPCWWIGWWLWRAGCISQDTYLLYSIADCNLWMIFPHCRPLVDLHRTHSGGIFFYCSNPNILDIVLIFLVLIFKEVGQKDNE